MTDSKPEPTEPAAPPKKVVFTKEAQPDLTAAQRREKAGINRNRIGTWIVISAFGLAMIAVGVIGLLTKSR